MKTPNSIAVISRMMKLTLFNRGAWLAAATTLAPAAFAQAPAAPATAPAAAPAPAAAAPATAPADALPAAPTFDGWTIKSDKVASKKEADKIAAKLGGKITALRNTVYDVSGKKVQINVIVASDDAAADKIFASLTKKKAEWSCARKGNVLYEFVGKNDAMDEMKKAHAQLSSN
jgi:hypothetical protein